MLTALRTTLKICTIRDIVFEVRPALFEAKVFRGHNAWVNINQQYRDVQKTNPQGMKNIKEREDKWTKQ